MAVAQLAEPDEEEGPAGKRTLQHVIKECWVILAEHADLIARAEDTDPDPSPE